MRSNEQIVAEFWPAIQSRFLAKGRDYDGGHLALGLAGQFSDINRKYWKLKRALWDGQDLQDEPVEEVIHDMIGHLLLTLDCLDPIIAEGRGKSVSEDYMRDSLGEILRLLSEDTGYGGLYKAKAKLQDLLK